MRRKEGAFILAQAIITATVLALVSLPASSAPSTIASSEVGSGPFTVYSASNDNLQLVVGVNSTILKPNQSLGISVDVRNTVDSENDVPLLAFPPNATTTLHWASTWHFQGSPITIWQGGCSYVQPVQYTVEQGNYSLDDLSQPVITAGPVSSIGGICYENPSYISKVVFQPDSDQANVTIGKPDRAVGTPSYTFSSTVYPVETSFTITGYSNQLGIGQSLYTIPFSPGIWTLAVSDEWGNLVVLHFTVMA